MDPQQHLEALARDGRSFAAACADFSAPVAACPGWTTADLVWHLAEVHHFWRTVVGQRLGAPDGYEQPARPGDDDLLACYRDGLDETLAVLRAADPAQPNWTWSADPADHTAGFVIRRMAHETAVHCWDAQDAAGDTRPIDAELSSDGIDEFLSHFLGAGSGAEPGRSVGGSVHLHCGDVPGEWTVRPDADGGFDVTREHAKGDAAIRGAAGDILLALWRRRPLNALGPVGDTVDTVEVVGDAAVAERFVAVTRLE